MAITSGEIYAPRSHEEIRDAWLSDVRLEAIAQGVDSSDVPVEEGTEWWIMGTAIGHSMAMLYANQQVHSDNRDVDKSSGSALDEIREQEGLDELPPKAATGRLKVQIDGTQTIPDGQEFTLPEGARGKVTPQVLGATDGQEVQVVMIDAGTRGNAESGTKATFLSPPGNLRNEATVSNDSPLTDGRDEETPAAKRRRIKSRRADRAAAGNWADVIETALNSSAGIQHAFVYPGIGGPSSRKVAIMRDIDPDNAVFDRAPSEAAADLVRSAIHRDLPSESETITQVVGEEDTDVALTLSIPDSPGLGGDGTGWLDDVVWPDLVGGDSGQIAITAIGTGATSWDIQVDAATTTSPIAGVTHVAVWLSVDQKFEVRRVETVAGATTAWQLKLDSPVTDSNGDPPQVGDYVCPAAANTVAYGETFRDTMRKLGPGENTADSARLPRSKRHPYIERREWPSDLNLKQLAAITNGHDEVSDGAWSYRSLTTPTVPASVATAPNVLKLRHFAIYKQ